MNTKATLKTITLPELNVGDIVHAHGARFEVYCATMYKEHEAKYKEHGPIMNAQARWLDGRTETGYFGPGKDWTFQGNKLATLNIETN